MTKALHRSIYARDAEVWRRADALVKVSGMSMSALVERALASHVPVAIADLSKEQLDAYINTLTENSNVESSMSR